MSIISENWRTVLREKWKKKRGKEDCEEFEGESTWGGLYRAALFRYTEVKLEQGRDTKEVLINKGGIAGEQNDMPAAV